MSYIIDALNKVEGMEKTLHGGLSPMVAEHGSSFRPDVKPWSRNSVILAAIMAAILLFGGTFLAGEDAFAVTKDGNITVGSGEDIYASLPMKPLNIREIRPTAPMPKVALPEEPEQAVVTKSELEELTRGLTSAKQTSVMQGSLAMPDSRYMVEGIVYHEDISLRVAMVRKFGETDGHMMKVGQQIDGYRLSVIERNAVTLLSDKQVIVLEVK